jgi:hypothetical protein
VISAFFYVMVVVVGSAAAGREVRDELDRIGPGERPADDEVERQWDEVTAQARSRWDTLRQQSSGRSRSRSRACFLARDTARPKDFGPRVANARYYAVDLTRVWSRRHCVPRRLP